MDENADPEYANMKVPCNGTFHQRMTHHNVLKRIQYLYQEQGPEIKAFWLKVTFIQLGFSSKTAKRLRALTDKNVDDSCGETRWQECQWDA